MRSDLVAPFNAALAQLHTLVADGADALAIARFVSHAGILNCALSHEVESRAFDGTIWADAFHLLCEGDSDLLGFEPAALDYADDEESGSFVDVPADVLAAEFEGEGAQLPAILESQGFKATPMHPAYFGHDDGRRCAVVAAAPARLHYMPAPFRLVSLGMAAAAVLASMGSGASAAPFDPGFVSGATPELDALAMFLWLGFSAFSVAFLITAIGFVATGRRAPREAAIRVRRRVVLDRAGRR